jgi:hypothetical protein
VKKLAVLVLIATLTLTGCSQLSALGKLLPAKPGNSSSEATPALSVAWEKSLPVKSSIIDNALFDNNICQSEPSINDGVYANDTLRDYKANTYRECSTFHDYETDGAKMECPMNAYIWTGAGAGTDVKHALDYEDGWSLAIFYGKGWQIEVDSPLGYNTDLTQQEIVKKCASTLASYSKLIGGGIVHYGDYKN